MKSKIPDTVRLGNNEIKKMVDKAKKEGKIKPISQMDAETPGGFQKVDDKETKRIIEGKFRDRIQIQNDLRQTEIAQKYRYVEAEELEKIFKQYDDIVAGNVDMALPEWYGLDMPKHVLVCEINMKIHLWKELMMKRNYLIKALENVGFTKTELEPLLIDGKIISDNDKLKELEETYDKKKLDEDEEKK